MSGEVHRQGKFFGLGQVLLTREGQKTQNAFQAMSTELVQLNNSQEVLVEVTRNIDPARQISGGELAKPVQRGLEQIEPMIKALTQPLVNSWRALNQDMLVESAELEVGLSFEAEGNLYVTKAKAEANLTLKLILKPKVP